MKTKSLLAIILVVALSLSFSTAAMAASTVAATVPVTLTVSNEYRAVNVTIPASLPVEVINGTVLTADNAQITNNSETGSVQVTSIKVTDGAYKVGNYEDFSGSKTIALKINGAPTSGSGNMKIDDTSFPEIKAEDSLKLTYYAKVSGDAPNADNVKAANVVFTIAIAD